MKPIVAINFKAYPNAFGKDADRMLNMIDVFSKEYSIETIVALPLTKFLKK